MANSGQSPPAEKIPSPAARPVPVGGRCRCPYLCRGTGMHCTAECSARQRSSPASSARSIASWPAGSWRGGGSPSQPSDPSGACGRDGSGQRGPPGGGFRGGPRGLGGMASWAWGSGSAPPGRAVVGPTSHSVGPPGVNPKWIPTGRSGIQPCQHHHPLAEHQQGSSRDLHRARGRPDTRLATQLEGGSTHIPHAGIDPHLMDPHAKFIPLCAGSGAYRSAGSALAPARPAPDTGTAARARHRADPAPGGSHAIQHRADPAARGSRSKRILADLPGRGGAGRIPAAGDPWPIPKGGDPGEPIPPGVRAM